MKRFYIFAIFSLFIFIFSGCTSGIEKEEKNANITVYTSIYPIQYMVEQIGGDALHVESIYPPGVDAHTYEPTSKEMTEIAKGDAFIYLGAGMEGFAENAVQALNNQDIAIIDISKNKQDIFLDSADHHEDEHSDEHGDEHHHHGDLDPHIWLDPVKMIQIGEMIKDELTLLSPDNKDTFEKNFSQLNDQLTELDHSFKQVLNQKKNKYLLVAHAAYGYWEDRYDIKQIAISGITTSDEPSQKELTNLIKFAKEHEITDVIFEQSGSDRVAKIIQEQLEADARYIHNLESLTEEDIENDEDYLSIMQKNLDVLDQALK